jgi:predicted nucleotidyltransferase
MKYPQAYVQVFGSFANGTSTFSSDLDISVNLPTTSQHNANHHDINHTHTEKGNVSLINENDFSAVERHSSNVYIHEIERGKSSPSSSSSSSSSSPHEVSWEISKTPSNTAFEVMCIPHSSTSQMKSEGETHDVECNFLEGETHSSNRYGKKRPASPESLIDVNRARKMLKNSIKSNHDNNDEFSKSTNFDELVPSDSSKLSISSHAMKIILKELLFIFRALPFVASIEYRGKARVPILCILHQNGISCDISIVIYKISLEYLTIYFLKNYFFVSIIYIYIFFTT